MPTTNHLQLGVPWNLIMLKLKLQYFGHLMRRVDSLEKTLMLGEIGGKRRRGFIELDKAVVHVISLISFL